MKKFILPIALLATVFTACKTEPKKEIETSRQLLLTPDTAGMYRSDASSDVAKSTGNYTAPTTNNAVATRTIIKHIYVPAEKPVVTKAPVAVPDPVVTTPPVVATTIPDVAVAPTTGTTPSETASIPAPVENKKKGISDAAKGAAIGGVGGAVAGAIIGKGGKGAIIGGVVGAAGGYILGRQKDKKSGRVEYASN